MVRKELTDYSALQVKIIAATHQKRIDGKFNQNLHDIFDKSNINIDDVETILETITRKLRVLESIYFTYFESEYDPNIIVLRSLTDEYKVIETELTHSTSTIKNRIKIDSAELYIDVIDSNFQSFILTVASLYENVIRLIEIFVKKITVHGKTKNPNVSVHMELFLEYWHNLVKLSYRKDDDFYSCFTDHEIYLKKYLKQINGLRNSFIHGYSKNVAVQNGSYYVLIKDPKNFSSSRGGFLPPDLILDDFVKEVLENSRELIGDLLTLLDKKLSHHMTKIPM